jgi:hypothetical protein
MVDPKLEPAKLVLPCLISKPKTAGESFSWQVQGGQSRAASHSVATNTKL